MRFEDFDQNVRVLVIGAGLAGSEAAFFLAERGIDVILVECKTIKLNPAQKMETCVELVCTNSLKSTNPESPHGLLKQEMEMLGSKVLEVGRITQVPAGEALAVDRHLFSQEMTRRLKNHPRISLVEEEITDPLEALKRFGCQYGIVATGPLTTSPLEKWIQENLSAEDFYFYDAIAPVVDGDSLDYSKLYYKDRHKKDGEENADYLNAPMNEEEYYRFVDELVKAEKVPPKDFEEYVYFESCLPIDTMAERGRDTPRFSCMRPVGLGPGRDDKEAGKPAPYAVVQLRKENLLGNAFNLVGFQTRLTYKEQVRIFRMIPGLETAQFIHLGSVHRNSFLNARALLNLDLSCKKFPQLYFAGQITGVEGYTESAMGGLYVAFQILRKIEGRPPLPWPVETATGALINYLMTAPHPRPSNVNFGLFPPVPLPAGKRRSGFDKKAMKKKLIAARAKEVLREFLKEHLIEDSEDSVAGTWSEMKGDSLESRQI